jgi:hypothetical protein
MPDDKDLGVRSCEAARPLLAAYVEGNLAPEREDALRSHAARCPLCRAALIDADPSAVFLSLRGRSLPDDFWSGFDQTLRARLEQERQTGWRWEAAREALGSLLRPPRLAYFAAPLAMVFLLGVTLYVTQPGRFGSGGRVRPPEEGLRSPYATTLTPRRGGSVPRIPREAAAPSAMPALAATEPPPLEEVRSPAARVYRLDLAGQDPTPIYMVVDETIEF